MIGWMTGRGARSLTAMTLIGWLMAACQAAAPAPTTPGTQAGSPADFTPISSAEPNSGGLSRLEQSAQSSGSLAYSGYGCVITEAGCSCEAPLVQQSSFVFSSNDHLTYSFVVTPDAGTGGAPPAQWEMERAGMNQWSYTGTLGSRDNPQGVFSGLLTFTGDGYIVTQIAAFRTDTIITCPDVYFRRASAP